MISFDDLLEQVGSGANPYQIGVVFCICVCNFFGCLMTISPVFTAASHSYHCFVSNATLNEYAANGELKNLTYHKCSVSFHLQQSVSQSLVMNQSMPSHHYESTHHITKCESYVFSQDEHYSTIRSQYGLVCEREYLNQLSSTIFFVGFMIGSAICGWMADQWGRLFALNVSIVLSFVASVMAVFSPWFILYVIGRLLVGIGVGGLLVTGYILGNEYVDKNYRLLWAIIMHCSWSVGGSLYSLVAYFIRNHFILQLLFTVPYGFLLLMNLFVYESPRWLYATGRFERCEKVLEVTAKWNKREIPPKVLTLKYESTQEVLDGNPEVKSTNKKTMQQGSMLDLFRTPGMRRMTICCWFLWFSCSLVYYGLLFVVQNVGGGIYVNTALGMLVEIPARFGIILVDRKYGRRVLLCGSLTVGAVTLTICGILKRVSLSYNVPSAALVALVLLGRFGMVFAFDVAWLSSSEVFPTVIRNFGVGSSSMWARIAGTLAPQIGALDKLWTASPLFLLAALPCISLALIVRYLPETRGIAVPETIEEGELLASRKSQRKGNLIDEENDVCQLQSTRM